MTVKQQVKSDQTEKMLTDQAEEMLTVNSVYTNVTSNHWLESLVWVTFTWAAQPMPFFHVITVTELFLVMKHP